MRRTINALQFNQGCWRQSDYTTKGNAVEEPDDLACHKLFAKAVELESFMDSHLKRRPSDVLRVSTLCHPIIMDPLSFLS